MGEIGGIEGAQRVPPVKEVFKIPSDQRRRRRNVRQEKPVSEPSSTSEPRIGQIIDEKA